MLTVLYFDGGWPNPGGLATFGWWVERNATEVAHGCGEAANGEGATNNVAEWSALIEGLRWIRNDASAEFLSIFGDSKLVIDALTFKGKCKAVHLQKLRTEALELLEQIGCRWSAEWIPRHMNQRADDLTNLARERIGERA